MTFGGGSGNRAFHVMVPRFDAFVYCIETILSTSIDIDICFFDDAFVVFARR